MCKDLGVTYFRTIGIVDSIVAPSISRWLTPEHTRLKNNSSTGKQTSSALVYLSVCPRSPWTHQACCKDGIYALFQPILLTVPDLTNAIANIQPFFIRDNHGASLACHYSRKPTSCWQKVNFIWYLCTGKHNNVFLESYGLLNGLHILMTVPQLLNLLRILSMVETPILNQKFHDY